MISVVLKFAVIGRQFLFSIYINKFIPAVAKSAENIRLYTYEASTRIAHLLPLNN